jgi:hypothetical protein
MSKIEIVGEIGKASPIKEIFAIFTKNDILKSVKEHLVVDQEESLFYIKIPGILDELWDQRLKLFEKEEQENFDNFANKVFFYITVFLDEVFSKETEIELFNDGERERIVGDISICCKVWVFKMTEVE